MKKGEKFRCYCEDCKLNTWHTVLELFKVSWAADDNEVSGENTYSIIICNGCDKVSYRTELICSEDVFYNEDGSFEYDVSVESYPPACAGVDNINNIFLIPICIRKIYIQTLHAIANKDCLIAAMGLRSVIESICLVENISGKDLKNKIGKMVTSGFLSKSEARMLQGIRFLGNDAVHELDEPQLDTIVTAMQIIEHLLMTKYILLKESQETLDLPIDTYLDFKEIVLQKMELLDAGSFYTINKLLGKDIRRIDEKNIAEFVRQLNKDIDEKNCNGIGRKDQITEANLSSKQSYSIYFKV